VFLSWCWLVSVDAGLRKMAIKERKKELINKPIIRNERPCRRQLNATSSPLGPATPVSLTTYEPGLAKRTSTNQDIDLIRRVPPSRYPVRRGGAIMKRRPHAKDIEPQTIMAGRREDLD
jgi:hypothetical protein